jgi:transposase-like protein
MSILPQGHGVSLPAGRVGFWQNMPMPPASPYRIELTVDERAALVALVRPTGQARMLFRARIVLAAADGASNAGIARDLAVCQDTVRKWRRRYARDRLAGLADAHRSGRPRRFTPVQRAQVTANRIEGKRRSSKCLLPILLPRKRQGGHPPVTGRSSAATWPRCIKRR